MIYVFLAEGFEEIEALAAVDVLRRARLEVQTVGVGGRKITGSHGITVVCDLVDDEARIDGLAEDRLAGMSRIDRNDTVSLAEQEAHHAMARPPVVRRCAEHGYRVHGFEDLADVAIGIVIVVHRCLLRRSRPSLTCLPARQTSAEP